MLSSKRETAHVDHARRQAVNVGVINFTMKLFQQRKGKITAQDVLHRQRGEYLAAERAARLAIILGNISAS